MTPIIDDEHKALPSADYVLTEGSAWIQCGNIAVYLHATDEGVICDMYPNGREMNDPLAACYAFFDEAEEAIQEEEARP